MTNTHNNNWHYELTPSGKSSLISFNERLIAIINRPSSGKWPVNVSINERMYLFSKKGLLPYMIEVKDAITKEVLGTIRMPLFYFIAGTPEFRIVTGENYNWYNNEIFSFHWKWKKRNETIVDAVENVAGKKNKGVIAICNYKTGTDLLIVSGFLLSVIKRNSFVSRLIKR